MKYITVCNRLDVHRVAREVNATHILSLLDRGVRPFLPDGFKRENWKLLEMEDVWNPNTFDAPKKEQIQSALDWSARLPMDASLIVHCEAGVSRSTAMALGIMVQKMGTVPDRIEKAAAKLIEIRPQACPNPLIAQYCDEILECNNAFFQASEEIAKRYLLTNHGI